MRNASSFQNYDAVLVQPVTLVKVYVNASLWAKTMVRTPMVARVARL